MWWVIVSVSVYNYFLVIKKGPRQSDNAPIRWVNGTFWHSIVLYIVLFVLDRQVRFFKLTVCFQRENILKAGKSLVMTRQLLDTSQHLIIIQEVEA